MTSFEQFKGQFGSIEDYLNRGYLNGGRPIPSNIPPLDNLLCGGFRSGLHVIGGEPAAGKSAFGLFVAMMSALSGANVMYCTLEMSRYQCIERCASFWSLETGLPFNGGRTWEYALKARERDRAARQQGRIEEYVKEAMSNDPVIVGVNRFAERCSSLVIADTEPLHDIAGIEQTTAAGVQAGLDMLIVDYLQFVSAGDIAEEYQRVSTVSKRLNRLGVTLNIPVIALASCARPNNKSTAQAPNMHVFKGSGDIEYHALSASIITVEPDEPSTRKLHVVKNRFGGLTSPSTCIQFSFDGAHNKFDLLDA